MCFYGIKHEYSFPILFKIDFVGKYLQNYHYRYNRFSFDNHHVYNEVLNEINPTRLSIPINQKTREMILSDFILANFYILNNDNKWEYTGKNVCEPSADESQIHEANDNCFTEHLLEIMWELRDIDDYFVITCSYN